jgi:hypothetical protein
VRFKFYSVLLISSIILFLTARSLAQDLDPRAYARVPVDATVLIICGVVIFFFTNRSTESASNERNPADKNSLIGNWLRTDASYTIKINTVNDDGTMSVQYFNPNPINFGKANWEENNGNLKINIELRDVNYPGSTYTLNYLHDRDMLAGEYYQAVEGLTFYIEFTRSQM